MRTVTLNGTMRLFTILQTGSSEQLAFLVKQGLENHGWGVQSGSISRNSIFNNTLNVSIVVNALGNDVSQRIDDGITNFLRNYLIDDKVIFRDVYLNIGKDTGAEVPQITNASAKPKQPTRTIVRTAPKTVDRGVIATVTIDPNSPENQLVPTDYQTQPDNSGQTPSALPIALGILFVFLILRD